MFKRTEMRFRLTVVELFLTEKWGETSKEIKWIYFAAGYRDLVIAKTSFSVRNTLSGDNVEYAYLQNTD